MFTLIYLLEEQERNGQLRGWDDVYDMQERASGNVPAAARRVFKVREVGTNEGPKPVENRCLHFERHM